MALFLSLLFCQAMLAQPQPQEDPLAGFSKAIATAQEEGRFADAAALREQARQRLDRLPLDAPPFPYWVQSVAQLYQVGGRTAQARAVIQSALDRAESSAAGRAVRVQLLLALAESWQQDHNLLKTLALLEKAVLLPVTPAAEPAASPASSRVTVASSPYPYYARVVMSGPMRGPLTEAGIYPRLADLYRQLGRPDAAAATVEKWKKVASASGDPSIPSYFERTDQVDEAVAAYQEALAHTTDPQQSANLLHSLANLYGRTGRTADAIAAFQQAAARMDALPNGGYQSVYVRQNLAGILQRSGKVAEADAIYQQLLAAAPPEQELQTLLSYTNYLTSSQRAAQATALLKQFQTSHPNLQPWEQNNLLYTLANTARAAGDSKLAEQYQAEAVAHQPRPSPETAAPVRLGDFLQKAQVALAEHKLEAAFKLACDAIDVAPRSIDRQQIAWQLPPVASSLAGQKATGEADLLYQRLFTLLETWSPDTLQPLTTLSQNHAQFLVAQHRWSEVPAAIERYRTLLIAAHGAETGMLEDPLHIAIEFARSQGSPRLMLAPVQELLALEESLSGNTSAPYLNGLRDLAGAYEQIGDRDGVIAARRRIVAIADRVFPARDIQRASARLDLAFCLSGLQQFDEAERLAVEAVAITKDSPSAQQFVNSLEEFRKIRATVQKGGTPVVQRDFLLGRPGQWFTSQPVVMQNDGGAVGVPIRH